jgi:hypothetical protein
MCQTTGLRQITLPNKPSNLKLRIASQRPFQMLYSRYQVDRVNNADNYPCKLKNVNNPLCRLCRHSREWIHCLLTDCV